MLLAVAAMMGISFVSCDKNDSEDVYENMELRMDGEGDEGLVVEYDDPIVP